MILIILLKILAPQNKLIQFWCYDIGDFEATAQNRYKLLEEYLFRNIIIFEDKFQHHNNKERLVLLPTFTIDSDSCAT